MQGTALAPSKHTSKTRNLQSRVKVVGDVNTLESGRIPEISQLLMKELLNSSERPS